MSDSASLEDCLKLLRKRFHYKLSRKRGLEIIRTDMEKTDESPDDTIVQEKLERLSVLRTVFHFLREKSA